MFIALRHIVALLIVLLVPSLGATSALAQRAEIFQSKRADYPANDLAIGGYDAVAYHTQKAAVAGNGQFRIRWKDAEWQFSTQANRDLFAKEPEKYAPQYGGHCAFAVAGGSTAAGDPNVWDVINGRLYINLSTGTQSIWRRDTAGMIQRGDQNWPRVIGR